MKISGALVAALFAGLGIWLGQTLTRNKPAVIIKEVQAQAPVQPMGPFVVDETRVGQLGFTPREMEILGLSATGLSNREIAGRLFVSENTVKTHSSRLFDKLGAKRRTQAVQIGPPGRSRDACCPTRKDDFLLPDAESPKRVTTTFTSPATFLAREIWWRRLMKRVTGIGGIFFKSKNPPQLYDWYEKHLGIQREAHGQGASFHWREPQAADGTEPGPKALTAWCIFPQTTKYFAASKASFMVNYRVDNLDALLEDLKKSGIEIDPHREDYDYGRFAWITDPDGNRIELWEPPKPKED